MVNIFAGSLSIGVTEAFMWPGRVDRLGLQKITNFAFSPKNLTMILQVLNWELVFWFIAPFMQGNIRNIYLIIFFDIAP